MSVVVLGPDPLVVPMGCSQMDAQFRSTGLEVYELGVNSQVQATDALGSLAAIIRRRASRPR